MTYVDRGATTKKLEIAFLPTPKVFLVLRSYVEIPITDRQNVGLQMDHVKCAIHRLKIHTIDLPKFSCAGMANI
jgi:hypothetical protein